MADLQDKIQKAKTAGYSDDEILSHLSSNTDYGSKIKLALDSGYKPDEILSHLSSAPAAKQPRANVKAEEPSISTKDVVMESLKRVPTGIAESFAQAPENIINLGKMAYGTAVTAAGRPELAPEVQAPPARIEQALTQAGYLKPLEGMTPSQRVLSAAVQGAGAGVLQPVQGVKQLAANALKGMVAGGAGETVTQATGNQLAGLATSMLAPGLITKAGQIKTASLEKQQKLNEVRDQTIREAKEAGYVIPPGSVSPTAKNIIAESVAGKTALEQAFSTKNQKVTDSLARKAVGLEESTPLTPETMKQIRNDEFQKGYAPLKQIGEIGADVNYMFDLNKIASKYAGGTSSFPKAVANQINDLVDSYRVTNFDSRHALDEIKKLREQSSASFRKGETGLAKAQKDIANSLERQIERHLADQDTPDAAEMLNNFKEARQRMAISHAVEDALHKGEGTVDASKLATAFRNDKYLSGELKTIAKFADTFSRAAQSPRSFGTPGANKLQAGLSVLGSGLGGLAGGTFGGVVGAAAPVAIPFAAREYLASRMGQRNIVPSYENVLANIAGQNITQPQLLNALLGMQATREQSR